MRELGVGDPRVELALHEGGPLVVFDVSQVAALRHLDVFGEALRGSERAGRLAEETAGGRRGGAKGRFPPPRPTCFLK